MKKPRGRPRKVVVVTVSDNFKKMISNYVFTDQTSGDLVITFGYVLSPTSQRILVRK
ncbi:unnamed protein product [Dovyalis caffra]|uniref:Uncharacterized protein n=1 Tax=Dovyalis caffra TaxID=77055 RepID=A0AAV1SLU8_9ROSI|nr:unnamed protein product [Dovyalis caffra]